MITYEQAMTCDIFHAEGKCSRAIGPKGGVVESVQIWRRNGKTTTWKTKPGFRLPVKHGLRHYDYLTEMDTHLVHTEEDCPLRHTSGVYPPKG